MIVYADIVFIENLIINCVILYVTAVLKKIKISYLRIFFSSICGSSYAVLSIVVIDNVIGKLILSIVMILIIFPTKNVKQILETLTTFYLVSITAGGAAIAISYLMNDYKINTVNGIAIVDFPILFSAVGIIIGVFLIITTINNLKSKISKRDIFYDIEIFIDNKKVKIRALLDTGNMLKDPISQRPVVIATRRSLKNVLPQEILEDIKNILGGDKLGGINQFANKIKLIPFKSLGNEHGILIGIKSNKIIVDNNEIKDVIIGIYEKEFSRTKKYDALIGIDLLYEEECNYEFNWKIKK